MPISLPRLLSRVLVLGCLAAAGRGFSTTPADLAARLARNEALFLIDLRSATAYQAGHIPGAMNIPLGLLPYKPIPESQPVVVYGDGLGLIGDVQALAAIRAKQGARGEVLEGGYAAWLSETRLSTAKPGVGPEKLPGITYDQLVAAGKGDMVLVDLRPATAEVRAASDSKPARVEATAAVPDPLMDFASKLGVPVVAPNGALALGATAAPSGSPKVAGAPARAAAANPDGATSNRLLVLVADSDSAASEAARQLRASGQYRFTILIGGTESIRHEGRMGSARMNGDGKVATPPATP